VDLQVMKTRHADIFQRVFDGKEVLFNAAHPLALAEKNVTRVKGRTTIRQAVGALIGPNTALHEKMVSLGIAHDYDVFDGVGHNLAAIYESLGEKNWAFYTRAFTGAKR
jgi:hypothetical protein